MATLDEDFVFRPLPAIENIVHCPFPLPNPLGPLANLPGDWGGKGFNVIWRPNHTPGQDRFLELNLTNESLKFETISGAIPNRGLLQLDINMFGMTYLQQISDANLNAGLHIEPGIWAVVPPTTNPADPATVVRMASIPHGTTILAQGLATGAAGPPAIPNDNILPFNIGSPGGPFFNFPEQNLAAPTAFRSPAAQIVGITQAMVDNPNSVLQAAIAGQTILSTTTLRVSTTPTAPVTGGGTANTAFLAGSAGGPNAVSASVSATFWIELVKGTPNFLQLQYSQLVILNFNRLSWPHITVGTLRKCVPVVVPPWKVDPDMPISELQKVHPPIPPEGARVRSLEPLEFRSLPTPKPTPAAQMPVHENPQAPTKPKS